MIRGQLNYPLNLYRNSRQSILKFQEIFNLFYFRMLQISLALSKILELNYV